MQKSVIVTYVGLGYMEEWVGQEKREFPVLKEIVDGQPSGPHKPLPMEVRVIYIDVASDLVVKDLSVFTDDQLEMALGFRRQGVPHVYRLTDEAMRLYLANPETFKTAPSQRAKEEFLAAYRAAQQTPVQPVAQVAPVAPTARRARKSPGQDVAVRPQKPGRKSRKSAARQLDGEQAELRESAPEPALQLV